MAYAFGAHNLVVHCDGLSIGPHSHSIKLLTLAGATGTPLELVKPVIVGVIDNSDFPLG
jgi:hypothetical protein